MSAVVGHAREPPNGSSHTRNARKRASLPRWWPWLVNSGKAETGPVKRVTGHVGHATCGLRWATETIPLSR
jgi:hypothetical protein